MIIRWLRVMLIVCGVVIMIPLSSYAQGNDLSGKPYDEWAIAGIRDMEAELTPLVADQFPGQYFDREEARENDRRPSLIENLTLAPDGETLFIGVLNSLEDRETRNSFCIHKLDTDIIQCNALPELATFDRSRQLLWSPDSRYLVFHQDFWRTQINSDIYLLDTETLEVANLTPDADPKARLIDPNRESDEPREDIFFDGAPFWSADSQTLYFVRHVEADPANGSWENIIQQIDMATRDMQEVMELGSEILWLSVGFHNQIALSPDGTQVVMTTPAPNKQDRFIRIANLETGDIRRLAAFDDLLLPVEAEREAIIDWIDWLDDGRGLIAQVSNGLIAPTPAQVVRIDPGSGDIMWLFNVSSETPEEEFVVTVMGSPRWSTLTTDGETIFYISQRLGLFTAPASLDSEPYLLGEPENLSPPRHDSFLGSVTSNGRLLSRMMLIEFE